jgi:LEA14-like dessication related protein
VVTLLAGFGCSGLGLNLKEPEFRLDRAVVRGIGLSGGTLDLVVVIDNPNNFSLDGTRLQLGVDVEGSHLGDITYDDAFTVTAGGQSTMTLPLQFGWSGVGNAIRAALSYGELPYQLKGQATLRLPGGLHHTVSFSHEGRAPLTRSGATVGVPASQP